MNSKKIVYDLIERAVIKIVLHLFKVSASFPTFLVTQLVSHGFDKLIVPILDYAIRTGQLYYDFYDGKIKTRNLNEAKKNKNKDEYKKALDDIFH